MTESRKNALKALIQLMDEPDASVYAQIRMQILDFGPEAIPVLEEALLNALNEENAARIQAEIDELYFNDIFDKIVKWNQSADHNLLSAYLYFTQYLDPEFSYEEHKQSVEKIIRDVWLEMNDELTALEKIKVLNHVFYKVYGFTGISENKSSVFSYLISNVLRLQKGNPLSLALLYLIIAQHIGMPMLGVDLPFHFILAYTDDGAYNKEPKSITEENILFYLNPFNKGVIFKRSEIELYLKQMKLEEKPDCFLPINNVHVVRRLIRETAQIQKKNGKIDKANKFLRLLEALE